MIFRDYAEDVPVDSASTPSLLAILAGAGGGLLVGGPVGAFIGAGLAMFASGDVSGVATSTSRGKDSGNTFPSDAYPQSFYTNIVQPADSTRPDRMAMAAKFLTENGYPWPLIGSEAWLSLGYTPGLGTGGTTAMQSMSNPQGKALLAFMPYLGIALQVGDTMQSIFGSKGLTLEEYRNNRRILGHKLAIWSFPPETDEFDAIQTIALAGRAQLTSILNPANKQAR